MNNPNPNPVVVALPGAGWVAAFRNDDGSEYREPLVAWLVRADGEMEPTCVCEDGGADDATSISNFIRLIRPTSDERDVIEEAVKAAAKEWLNQHGRELIGEGR